MVNYIYFIASYENSKEYKLYLPSEYPGCKTLEIVEETIEKHPNFSLNIKMYRFEIIQDYFINMQKKQIPIIMEEKNKEKHKYNITIFSTTNDFYEYNFKIEEIDVLPLDYEKQFEKYIKILRKKFKQDTKENDDFILASHTILVGNTKTISFFFLSFNI